MAKLKQPVEVNQVLNEQYQCHIATPNMLFKV